VVSLRHTHPHVILADGQNLHSCPSCPHQYHPDHREGSAINQLAIAMNYPAIATNINQYRPTSSRDPLSAFAVCSLDDPYLPRHGTHFPLLSAIFCTLPAANRYHATDSLAFTG
jgi:hypothetical protein